MGESPGSRYAGERGADAAQARRLRAEPLSAREALPPRPARFLSGCPGGWVISSRNSTQNAALAQCKLRRAFCAVQAFRRLSLSADLLNERHGFKMSSEAGS